VPDTRLFCVKIPSSVLPIAASIATGLRKTPFAAELVKGALRSVTGLIGQRAGVTVHASGDDRYSGRGLHRGAGEPRVRLSPEGRV